MFACDEVNNVAFYQQIFDLYDGNIMVSDATGRIVFVSICSPGIEGFDQQKLLNTNIHTTAGSICYATGSATAKVLENKKQCYSAHFVGEKEKSRVLAYAKPIFDENGELKYVVSYGWEEKDLYALLKRLDEEKSSVKNVLHYIQGTNSAAQSFIAQSSLMKAVMERALRVAESDSTVILYGESGSGKEVMAKYIHANSSRRDEVFIPINCSAIPKELLESEMFGYSKGAFTGGNREGNIGLFEFANNGTIFLDEIGDCPLELQTKLLRVLENGEIRRVGSNKIITTNARIIAATNRNLQELVHEGKFRADLYYRLNVIPITLPPLRERVDDIEPLARRFAEEYNKKYHLARILSPQLIHTMLHYTWPGNVRELKNCIERMIITADSDIIDAEAFPYHNPTQTTAACRRAEPRPYGRFSSYEEAMAAFERDYFQQILESYGWDVKAAAQQTKMHISTLYRKIEKLGLKP